MINRTTASTLPLAEQKNTNKNISKNVFWIFGKTVKLLANIISQNMWILRDRKASKPNLYLF
jgi:hypothetical protein